MSGTENIMEVARFPNSVGGSDQGVPVYFQGPSELIGDVVLDHRIYFYESGAAVVAGSDSSVVFTVDHPASDVWPYFRNWNLWQDSLLHYSGIPGDMYNKLDGGLGNEAFSITNKPTSTVLPHRYIVLKVVPERLIVWFQPVPEDGSNGGMSRGFHVFTLHQHAEKTTVTCLMHHAARSSNLTQEEALAPWRAIVIEANRRWRDHFIPTLKRMLSERTASAS